MLLMSCATRASSYTPAVGLMLRDVLSKVDA